MSLTYILIDFENVQPTAADMRLIRGMDYRVWLFHGPHQNNFDVEMVKAWQPLGVQFEYFQCERKGKNALDFHIAFCLGRLVQECEVAASLPGGSANFLIVSKDSGFDVLLGHIRALGYGAARIASVPEALASMETTGPLSVAVTRVEESSPAKKAAVKKLETTAGTTTALKAPPAKPATKVTTPASTNAAKYDAWARVLDNLRDHPNNRPTTIVALQRHIKTLLRKGTPEQEVQALRDRLQREGVAALNGKKLEYNIPKRLL